MLAGLIASDMASEVSYLLRTVYCFVEGLLNSGVDGLSSYAFPYGLTCFLRATIRSDCLSHHLDVLFGCRAATGGASALFTDPAVGNDCISVASFGPWRLYSFGTSRGRGSASLGDRSLRFRGWC